MKSRLLRKFKLVAVLAVVAVLALSALGSVFADFQPQQVQVKQGLFGNVTAKAQDSLTVKTSQGETVKLAVTGQTEFRASGKGRITLDDVASGSRVAVLAEGGAGSLTALKVMLVPGEPQTEHRLLTVIDVSGKTVIAEDAQGNRVTVELDHELSPEVKGMLVTFVGTRSGQSDRFKANTEVKIEQIVKRLEAQAKKLDAEARGEANAEVKVKKERQLDEIRARLEANMQRQLDLFAELIARAPEQAKPALTEAMAKIKMGFEDALKAVGETGAQVEGRIESGTLHGSVVGINPQANEITLLSRGGATVTFMVNADTQFRIGDKKDGVLGDIAVGDLVKVNFKGHAPAAAEVRVDTEAKAEGSIQSIDSAGGKLVLTLANGSTLTLKLTSDTRIEVNNKKVTTADLKVNQMVKVKYNVKTLEAISVEAETRAEVKGAIKSIDNAAGTVTILSESGKEVTIKVNDTTRVKINGVLFGLLGLSAGMKVEARYDLVTGIAAELKTDNSGPGSRQGPGAPLSLK